MSTYLLTGASGFVGSEVLRQLKSKDQSIIAVGNTDPEVENVRFIRAKITDMQELKKRLTDQEFDYIFHIASIPGDTGDPKQMVEVNVRGCLNMLEIARQKGIKRIVVASSISAYEWYPATKFSPPEYLPVDEAHPTRPRDMYSSTKLMQEILATTYFHQYGVPACALRLTAVVGPRGRGGGRGWGEIAQSLAKGENVQIPHFSLDEVCHYVDIRDVARMMIHCTAQDSASGQIFNCCGPYAVSGREFAETIHHFYPDINVKTGFPWSMAQGGKIEFSMRKAKDLMGFEPQYTLYDSIALIKNWIDSSEFEDSIAGNEKFGGGVKSD